MKRLLMTLSLVCICGMTLPSSPAFCQDFDREACYRGCRRTIMPLLSYEGDRETGYRIAGSQDDCLQECERKFWEDFEKKDKGRKDDFR
jgi:hypothetical protein